MRLFVRASKQSARLFYFAKSLRLMSVLRGLQKALRALAEAKWKVAWSAPLVSYLLVELKAERCFVGISVQLSHVHVGPAFHRPLGRAVSHERERETEAESTRDRKRKSKRDI